MILALFSLLVVIDFLAKAKKSISINLYILIITPKTKFFQSESIVELNKDHIFIL